MSDLVVTVKVPAKINLALRVGGVMPDGYHPLATVFQAVSLYDVVRAELAPAQHFSLTVAGPQAHLVPTDESNLALRAARLVAQRFERPNLLGVKLHIDKDIPVTGGMAGGSADAAAALLACARLWHLLLAPEELAELGAELGADVPFCLLGGTALGTGRGDQLAPILTRAELHWAVAMLDVELSTPEVFRAFDRLVAERAGTFPEVPTALLQALASGSVETIAAHLENDLEGPARSLQPAIARLLAAGRSAGARAALLSGSGPTCLFLADDREHAIDLAVHLSSTGLCRDVRAAHGPVPGARVI